MNIDIWVWKQQLTAESWQTNKIGERLETWAPTFVEMRLWKNIPDESFIWYRSERMYLHLRHLVNKMSKIYPMVWTYGIFLEGTVKVICHTETHFT